MVVSYSCCTCTVMMRLKSSVCLLLDVVCTVFKTSQFDLLLVGLVSLLIHKLSVIKASSCFVEWMGS